MKHFMKVSAIMAVILIVLGLALAIPTIAIKGRAEVSNIAEEVTNGRLHINFGSVENWGLYLGNNGDGIDFKDGEEIISGTYEGAYAADGITGLQIEMGGCSMEIKPSEDSVFHVSTAGVGKFQMYAEGGTVCMKSEKKSRLIGGNTLGTVVLYVPQDMSFTNVDIALGAGEVVTKTALDAQKLKLSVGAGQVVCNDTVQAASAEVSLGAGEAVFKDMSVGELEASVGMGNLEFTGSVEKKAELECSMGSILMKLAGSENDYNYKLDASMGEVRIGDYSLAGLGNEQTISNNASCDIELECSMGNIEVSFMD